MLKVLNIFTGRGIIIDEKTTYTARIMVLSVIPFIVFLAPSIFDLSSTGQHIVMVLTLFVSVVFLFSYFLYQVSHKIINSCALREISVLFRCTSSWVCFQDFLFLLFAFKLVADSYKLIYNVIKWPDFQALDPAEKVRVCEKWTPSCGHIKTRPGSYSRKTPHSGWFTKCNCHKKVQ